MALWQAQGCFVQRKTPGTAVLGQRQPHGWALLAERVGGWLQGRIFLGVLSRLLLETAGTEPQPSRIWTEAMMPTVPGEAGVPPTHAALGVRPSSPDLTPRVSPPLALPSSYASLLAAPTPRNTPAPPASGPLHMLGPLPFPPLSLGPFSLPLHTSPSPGNLP